MVCEFAYKSYALTYRSKKLLTHAPVLKVGPLQTKANVYAATAAAAAAFEVKPLLKPELLARLLKAIQDGMLYCMRAEQFVT